MSQITEFLKTRYEQLKELYEREPVAVNTAVLTVLTAVGVPVAVAGVPVATIVGIVLGGVVFGTALRQSVFAPATVQEIAAEAAEVSTPKRKKRAARKR